LNKKLKISVITLAVITILGVSISACMALMPKANLKPSDYDLGVTYEQASKEDKPILAVFYVDWCTYCQRFMPKLNTVRKMNKNAFNVVLINVDDPSNEKIAKENRVTGFPTVYVLDPAYDNRVHIDSPYLESVSSLNKEIQRYLNFRKLVTKGEKCK